MAEQIDWFVRARDLGIPSSLAHDTYQQDGIPALQELCESWGKERTVVAAEIIIPSPARVEIDESPEEPA